jgi:hypothetical protein
MCRSNWGRTPRTSGLGLYTVGLMDVAERYWLWGPFTSGCAGTWRDYPANQCKRMVDNAASYAYGMSALDEGKTRVRIKAIDMSNNAGYSPEFELRIDESPPTISLLDELSGLDGDYVDQRDYLLDITANDPYSGAKRIDVTVNGVPAVNGSTGDVPCAATGGCSVPLNDWRFNPNHYEADDDRGYVIEIRATDMYGHTSPPRTLTVYDRPTPRNLIGEPADETYSVATTSGFSAGTCVSDPVTGSCFTPVYTEPEKSLSAGYSSGGARTLYVGREENWGLADNNAEMFKRQNFKDLQVGRVRLMVNYDLMTLQGVAGGVGDPAMEDTLQSWRSAGKKTLKDKQQSRFYEVW